MHNIYIKFNSDGNFHGFYFQENLMIEDKPYLAPELGTNDFVISVEERDKYLSALNGDKDVILKNGKIKIVDKPKEFFEEQKKQQFISEAQALYTQNEYRWNNQILWSRYTEDEKTKLMEFHDHILDVISGKSTILPKFE